MSKDCNSAAQLLNNKVLKLVLSNSESNFSNNKKKPLLMAKCILQFTVELLKKQLFTEQHGRGPERAISNVTGKHTPI